VGLPRETAEGGIPILENHDDFGGHARRNEFQAGGRLLLGYGGSESFQPPRHLFSDEVSRLLGKLGVKVERLVRGFNQSFYPELKLSRGVFSDRETFGENRLVSGDPTRKPADDVPPGKLSARSWAAFIGDFPLPEADRAALLELHTTPRDCLAGKSVEEKLAYLDQTSYRDFLRRDVGLSEAALNYLQGRSNDFMALGIDALPASAFCEWGFPGFAALGLPPIDAETQAELDESYIYHFPDGNASVARLLVRSLIPAVARGRGTDDIVLARFDYGMLDVAGQLVRLRLNSSVVSVRNRGGGVDVGYSRNGRLHHVRAKHCVLACYNMMIPYICATCPRRRRRRWCRT